MTTTVVLTTLFLQMVLHRHLSSKSKVEQLPPDVLVINNVCHPGSLVDHLLTRLHKVNIRTFLYYEVNSFSFSILPSVW